jgi:hypothetical protein
VVIRDAINAGDLPGPRYLANGKEMARRDGDLVAGITAYADGPDEMREVINHHVNLGVDQIKLSMSGEEVRNTKCQPPWENDADGLPRSLKSGPPKTATFQTRKQPHASRRHTSWAEDSVLMLAPVTL